MSQHSSSSGSDGSSGGVEIALVSRPSSAEPGLSSRSAGSDDGGEQAAATLLRRASESNAAVSSGGRVPAPAERPSFDLL
jgi:hypothetical protein